MATINEKDFGKGCLPQKEDKRDKAFRATAPFDWELGFDIELLLGYRKWCGSLEKFFGPRGREGWGLERYKEIVEEVNRSMQFFGNGGVKIMPFKIPVKNQGASSSCTGQGLSYYLSVLNMIETGEWVEISARDIYAYIHLESGGAYLREALKLACGRGIATEDLVPCYHEIKMDYGIVKNPYNENEYREKPEESEAINAIRIALQSMEYKLVIGSGEMRMEEMAWAMLMGFGVYFAVDGQNGKNWTGEYPQTPDEVDWAHALFGGKCGLDKNGEKFIGPINSWGNGVGAEGWQKLLTNYFKANFAYSPWTLIDKNNNWNDMTNNQNVKIIKDKNSPAVGIWLPALSPEALESYCLNFGIPVPRKDDGSIDWSKWIDGELVLN